MSRRRVVIGVAVIGVCAVVFGVRLLSRTAMVEAVPIRSVDGWNCRVHGFWWLTANRALVAVDEGRGWRIVTVDIPSGRSTPVPAQLEHDLVRQSAIPMRVIASPDGRWAICVWMDYATFFKGGFAAVKNWPAALIRLDSSRPVPLHDFIDALWDADSHGWLEDDGEKGLFRNRIRKDGSIEKRSLGSMAGGSIMGRDRSGDLVVLDTRFKRRMEYQIQHVGEAIGGVIWDDMAWPNVSPPGDADMVHGIELSPDGERLLWLSETPVHDWRARFPVRMQSWLGFQRNSRRWEMWITDLAGGSRVYLGATVSGRKERLSDPRWTPDGRAITFERSRTVWTMAAPISVR